MNNIICIICNIPEKYCECGNSADKSPYRRLKKRYSGVDVMQKIIPIFPANDFKVVVDNAKKEIECGIVIGYDRDGELCVFGGGLMDGKQPACKDFLWMVDSFKHKLINGDYAK